MPAAKKTSAGRKVYGPYKGSKANGGRKIMVIRKADGSTTSTNAARYNYEKKTGKKLARGTEVDHKDNNHSNDSTGNLQAMSKSKNVAKGNTARRGSKARTAAKKAAATRRRKGTR